MCGNRYPDELKIKAIEQVVDRGYKIGEVAKWLGITSKNLRQWVDKIDDSGAQHQTITAQQEEVRLLKAQLRRVTEERDILKEAAVGSISHCNRYPNRLICSESQNEANLYMRRTRSCF